MKKTNNRYVTHFKKTGKMPATLWFDWDSFIADFGCNASKYCELTQTKTTTVFHQYYNMNKISREKIGILSDYYKSDLVKYVYDTESELIRKIMF